MKRLSKLGMFITMGLLIGACTSGKSANSADSTNQTPEQTLEQVKKKVKANLSGVEIDSVRAIKEVPGIYEVDVGGDTAYVEQNGKYAFIGQLLNLKTHENVTQKYQEGRLGKAYKNLPFEYAIKEVKGNGKHKVVLFSDPDCPFCKKIEQTLATMEDVTIYTFMAPIPELHPEAARHAELVWCSKDRLQMWHDYMLSNKPLPDSTGDCKAPMDAWVKLKRNFKVRATPTLLFPNGKLVAGALPKESIDKIFDELDGKKEASADQKSE
jgi:thiol:disulfide interchange protein DsbC